MPGATSYRVKVRRGGKLKTVGRAKTPSGLKRAYSRAREENPSAPLTVVCPDGKKHEFGPEKQKLTGAE